MRPQWFAIPPEYLDKDKEGRELGKETSTSILKSDDGLGVSYPPIPFELMWPDDELWMPLLLDRKSTRLNSSHSGESRMPSSA